MNNQIKESDWKIFKELRPLALQRYCERVMEDVDKIIHVSERDAHERYIEMYKIVRDGDKRLPDIFADQDFFLPSLFTSEALKSITFY
jgi:hypothetical protein